MDKDNQDLMEVKRRDVLDNELKKAVESKTMLELNIAVQKELDPEEISAKKPLRYAQNGQPISYENIKRKEFIEMLEKDLENINLKIETINKIY